MARRGALSVVFGAALGAVAILCLEGLASFRDAIWGSRRELPVAEWRYCEHDPDLGWISKPGVREPGVFGPGQDVVTNARRFRQSADVAPRVPPGKIRVICSGDSFTFGYGVDTATAWCNQLARIDARIEPVNMGQGGYGLDQSYLWYRRDGAPLEHDVHVLAFINMGFARMEMTEELGYAKPVLALAEGRLEAQNTPVRKRPRFWRLPAFQSTAAVVRALHLAGAARSLRLGLSRPAPAPAEDVPAVVEAIVDDLALLARAKGRALVLLYLPTEEDCISSTPAHAYWGGLMRERAARAGATFVDLVPACRQLPPPLVASLFISGEDTPYAGASGHYSAEGNRFVAAQVYAALAGDPRVQALAGARLAPSAR